MTFPDLQEAVVENDTIINEHIKQCIESAKQESKALGIIKYFYYVSPLGWMFSYDKHKLTIEITKQLLKD